jgi:hypothetical protein
MTMRPFLFCMINGECGSFVSKELEPHEKSAEKKVYRVFYHPIVGGNGGKWISKPEKLPYFIPEDAFFEDTVGKSSQNGVPEKIVIITHDVDGYSKYMQMLNKKMLDVVNDKNKTIEEYATKIAKQSITMRDSVEEAKKVLKDTKDMQKVIEPEKKNPFGHPYGGSNPWRSDD